MTDVDSMVDNFVDKGASASAADLSFTLTQDMLDKIKSTFKPLQFEDHLLFEFLSDGKIIVSSADKGITAWVEMSTTEMDLRDENYQSFYLDVKRINKLCDVCQGQINFVVADGEIKATIGTTDLHISMPMYELHVDISFTGDEGESKQSDDVAGLAGRCQASKGSGTFMIGSMLLGEDWRYGTTQNVSIVSGGFDTIKTHVDPEFLSYIANLPFTKEDILFEVGQDDDESPMVKISSDNVHYKIPVSTIEFVDMDPLFEAEVECEIQLNTLDTIAKLGILSIPLVGMDNAPFRLETDGEGNGIKISVMDEGQRSSHDEWQALEIKGELNAELGIQSYLNTVNAMSKENIKLKSTSEAIVLEDDVQKTILIKYM